MNIKKIVIASAGVLVMLGAGSAVFAELIVTAPTVAPVRMDQKMVLEIGPAGRTLLRGTVSAVGVSSLTVKSWGGDWTVNVATTTKLLPRNDIAQFAVGDFVGVQGTVSTTTAWTIDASLVKNWTARKEVKEERKENKQDNQQKVQSLLEQIKKLQAQLGTSGQ